MRRARFQTFIVARRLFAITYVLEMFISVFWPQPWETVKVTQNLFRILDLSRLSAFIGYIVYLGCPVPKPEYGPIFTWKSHLENKGPEPP